MFWKCNDSCSVNSSVMAAASLSMRMTLFGIQKVFPSVRTVTCEQVEEWRNASSKNLVCLVGTASAVAQLS